MLSLLLGQAYAFCGHYVGGVGDELSNNASEVAIVRQGQRTTLTLANDYEGDATDFAVLIPVPQVLQQSDVKVVDQELVPRLASYSAPRLVRYTCDDFGSDTAWDDAETDSGGSGGPNAEEGADGVVVENQFTVGAYEIVILSAQESSGLMSWLETNDYAVSDNAEDLLGEYIDGGAFFFAAKVSIEAVEGAAVLPPLQFGYESAVFSLPVRLGTLNATGEQDLLIYVLGENGQTHISNYPETTLESDCMVDLTDYPEGLWSFYQESLKKAVGEHERPAWLIEYSWNPSGCDPCADEPPTTDEMAALGWSGDTDGAHFTRLHMHYAPEQVDQDLVLYESGINDWSQLRWIEYAYEQEAYFPICGVGMADDPGDCNGGTVDEPDDSDPPQEEEGDPTVDPEPRRACGTPVLPAMGLALMALAAVRRR
jgi:hypothetical protein